MFCGSQGHTFYDCNDTTDCYALRAPAILKTFEIRPNRATFVFFDCNDTTDCYALRAPAILKTFEIRPNRATFSCFAGPKVILFHVNMKSMTFGPWYHHIIKWDKMEIRIDNL